MKKFNKTMKGLMLLSLLSILLTSRYATRTSVGSNAPVGKDASAKEFSHAKQFYLFWGLLPLNNAEPAKPSDGNYQVKSTFSFGDCIINGLLLDGIFGMRTVRIMVKSK